MSLMLYFGNVFSIVSVKLNKVTKDYDQNMSPEDLYKKAIEHVEDSGLKCLQSEFSEINDFDQMADHFICNLNITEEEGNDLIRFYNDKTSSKVAKNHNTINILPEIVESVGLKSEIIFQKPIFGGSDRLSNFLNEILIFKASVKLSLLHQMNFKKLSEKLSDDFVKEIQKIFVFYVKIKSLASLHAETFDYLIILANLDRYIKGFTENKSKYFELMKILHSQWITNLNMIENFNNFNGISMHFDN